MKSKASRAPIDWHELRYPIFLLIAILACLVAAGLFLGTWYALGAFVGAAVGGFAVRKKWEPQRDEDWHDPDYDYQQVYLKDGTPAVGLWRKVKHEDD